MAADMPNTIMDYFVENLQTHVNFGLPTNDVSYLDEVIKAPLQDDPTARAYYLTISPDTTLMDDNVHWRAPVSAIKRGMLGVNQDHPEYEIGGGFLYVNFFLLKGWMPEQTTREVAYERAGDALRRLERGYARIAYQVLTEGGLVTDDGMESTDAHFPQVFTNDGAHFEIGGGENQWFPRLYMRFHVFTQVEREWYLE